MEQQKRQQQIKVAEYVKSGGTGRQGAACCGRKQQCCQGAPWSSRERLGRLCASRGGRGMQGSGTRQDARGSYRERHAAGAIDSFQEC